MLSLRTWIRKWKVWSRMWTNWRYKIHNCNRNCWIKKRCTHCTSSIHSNNKTTTRSKTLRWLTLAMRPTITHTWWGNCSRVCSSQRSSRIWPDAMANSRSSICSRYCSRPSKIVTYKTPVCKAITQQLLMELKMISTNRQQTSCWRLWFWRTSYNRLKLNRISCNSPNHWRKHWPIAIINPKFHLRFHNRPKVKDRMRCCWPLCWANLETKALITPTKSRCSKHSSPKSKEKTMTEWAANFTTAIRAINCEPTLRISTTTTTPSKTQPGSSLHKVQATRHQHTTPSTKPRPLSSINNKSHPPTLTWRNYSAVYLIDKILRIWNEVLLFLS